MIETEKFIGSRLKLARALRERTNRSLADEAALSPGYISQLEKNDRRPSREVLEAIACSLGFRPEFFCRPLLDAFGEDECHFRRLAATSARQKKRAVARGTLVNELLRHLEESTLLPEVNVPAIQIDGSIDSIEHAAQRCRAAWGIPPTAPITRPTRVAEHAGVVVIRLDQATRDVDAFSRWGERPIILLNTSRGSTSRDRLNVGHELGHLVLHRTGGPDHEERETQAFRFGQALLFPRGPFVRQFWTAVQSGIDGLRDLKRQWGLSIAALIYRAKDLGLINAAEYRRLNRTRGRRGWISNEPDEPPVDEPELMRSVLDAAAALGRGPQDLAAELGWTLETFQLVTGVEVPDRSVISIEGAPAGGGSEEFRESEL